MCLLAYLKAHTFCNQHKNLDICVDTVVALNQNTFRLLRCTAQLLISNQRTGSALYYKLSCYQHFSLLLSPLLSKEVRVVSMSPRLEVSDGKGCILP